MDVNIPVESKIPGPPIGYVDMLDVAINKKLTADALKPVERNPLRPSSAGKCAREKAYEFMEYRGFAKYEKELNTPELYRIFDMGHGVEYSLLRQFGLVEALQIKYKQQTLTFYPISETEVVEGSIDVVFLSKKWKCIADVKSKKDKFSHYYASKWDEDSAKLKKMDSVQEITENAFWVEDLPLFLEELNDPFFRANFVQLNMYAVNPFITERGIDHAAIIQYNKNDSRLREVRFKPSMELYLKQKETDQNIARIIDTTRDPEQVPRDYTLGSIKCAFCDFKSMCWGPETNTMKPYFQSLPDKKFWPKDTNRLGDIGVVLEDLFQNYTELQESAGEIELVEKDIVKYMVDNELTKIRLVNGHIYDLKYLKSPHPHFDLRRSKL